MKRLLLCALLVVPLAALAGGRKPQISLWEFMAEWQGIKQERRQAEFQPNYPYPPNQPNYPSQPNQPNQPYPPNQPNYPSQPNQLRR